MARRYEPLFRELDGALDLILRGVDAGRLKGGKLVPAQGLALSKALRDGAFPQVDVDRDTALAFLRRESLGGFDPPSGIRQQPRQPRQQLLSVTLAHPPLTIHPDDVEHTKIAVHLSLINRIASVNL